MKKILHLLCLLLLAVSVSGKEYFVSPDGKDSGPGTLRSPFATFAKALSVMQGGDSMNILPGIYFQALDASQIKTSPDKKTVIRAVYPGTVLLRGDMDAPVFTKVPGTNFTYVCDWPRIVQGVNERDTLSTYQLRNNYTGLDFERGAWFYDKANKKLYVVTGDGRSPQEHYLTISCIEKIGVTLGKYKLNDPTRNLIVEGLAVTGFNFHGDITTRPTAKEGICGRFLDGAVIRDCVTFLCGGGIRLWKPVNTVIENCRAYGNGVVYAGSGGNIIINGPTENCAIRNCLAFNSCKAGIRFYGGTIKNCTIDRCVAAGHGFGDIWCKGSSDGKSFIRNSTALGCIYPSSSRAGMPSTEANNVYYYTSYSRNQNSIMTWRSNLDLDKTFADPENWDFRLQKNAKAKGGLVDRKPVYFLSPKGKDTNDGRSIATAWRTLQKVEQGSTVYLLPGVYGPLKVTVPDVTIAGRSSKGYAVISGGKTGLLAAAPGVTVERVSFINQTGESVRIAADNVKITNCGFSAAPAAVTGAKLKNIIVSNCAFTGVPYDFTDVQASIHSNIMAAEGKAKGKCQLFFNANAFPVKNSQPGSWVIVPEYTNAAKGQFTLKNAYRFNGRGMLGYPVGPYRLLTYRETNTVTNLRSHAVGDTVASIEFFNGINNVKNHLYMGESPDKLKPVVLNWNDPVSPFRTYTFNGLKPGKKYYIRVDSLMPSRILLSNEDISTARQRFFSGTTRGPVLEFTTLKTAPVPREYHVSVKGNDSNPGTAAKPFRTISKAASVISAGDTVTVHEGVYKEAVRLRSGGTEKLPITFRAAPKEKVYLDGDRQKLSFTFRSQNKSHLRFDGFRCRFFSSTESRGAFQFVNGRDVRVTRTIFDGRAPNFTGGSVQADNISDLLIENCVTVRGFQGMWLNKCDNAVLRNNLFHINQLTPIAMNFQPMKAVITHNIFFDTVMQKQRNALMTLPFPEMLTVENNCFYLRIPASERFLTGAFAGNKGQMTFTAFRKLKGGKETNIFANPQLLSTPQIKTFSSLADRDKQYPACAVDEEKKELGMISNGIYKAWDWKDYFPQNPACKKKTAGRPMGPDPAAFKGFL